MADSSQKFIARNRAPRVQIEYDVELYGAEKKVQLPFVMGVLSDLSGKSKAEAVSISDRKFLEIDVDNFDDRMKAMAPRVAFSVPNTLTGDGNLSVDLTFEKMGDFNPAQIAAKIEPLQKLLDARTQLATLMAYMDGKAGAEALIEKILADPGLLATLASGPVEDPDPASTLDALRELAPEDAPEDHSMAEALATLPQTEVVEHPDETSDVLSNLSVNAPEDPPEDTSLDDALASLPEAIASDDETDMTAGVLSDLAGATPEEAVEDTSVEDALSSVPDMAEDEAQDEAAGILSDLADQASDAVAEDNSLEEALSSLPETEEATETDYSEILSDLAEAEPEVESEDSSVDDLLGELAEMAPVEDTTEGSLASDTLASLPDVDEAEDIDDSSDILSDLADAAPDDALDDSTVDGLLSDLADLAPDDEALEDTSSADALASLPVVEEADDDDESDDILSDLADAAPEEDTEDSSIDDLLGDIADMAPEDMDQDDESDDILAAIPDLDSADDAEDLDDVLGDLAENVPEESADDVDDLDALLGDLSDSATEEETSDEVELDDLLGDLALDDEGSEATAEEADGDDLELDELFEDDPSDDDSPVSEGEDDNLDLDDLLDSDATEGEDAGDTSEADLDDLDLDSLLGDDDTTGEAEEAEGTETDQDDLDIDSLLDDTDEEDPVPDELDDLDLDDLLSSDASEDDDAADTSEEDLDDLDLDDLFDDDDSSDDVSGSESAETDLDDLDLDSLLDDSDEAETMSDDADDFDLDDLLSDDDDSEGTGKEVALEGAKPDGEPMLAFGRMSADRPDPERLKRSRFRIAVFGDFSGRSARGQIETGDALAARKPILLDSDTVEDVIAGFATTLVLPIGKDGAGIEVKLNELEDLHPDELYENVELFEGLAGLKGQLSAGATADHAAKQLTAWGEEFGQAVVPPRKSSGGNTVRADLKLSDFQKLIGDTGGELAQPSPVDDLLKRVVGPHIHKLPSPDVAAMQTAVDDALSTAMRLVLHHPEFQSVEAQWRSLDLIARSVEDDDTLDVILYDVSAEEIAADLAAEEDLAQTGLVRLLTEEPLDEENGRGGYSALIGLYTFEETPPHAELLGRVGRVAAHVDAPFISAITPAYLDIKKDDRHPLVVKAWDTFRMMPEAGHVGLASPRFLLRRPYGAKSEPIYEFEFEEFTEAEGLRGMLWANPAVLVTILLARSFKQNGKAMNLGSVMSLGGMPYHFVNDRYGDQMALPCTERNISLDKHEHSVQRGYMPLLSVKGRDEIRLGSFNSVAGQELLGPWSGVPAPAPSPDAPDEPEAEEAASDDEFDIDDLGLDDDSDLGLDLDDDDTSDLDDDDFDLDLEDDDSGGLDDFLSAFDDDAGDDGDEDEMDPELAALLADL